MMIQYRSQKLRVEIQIVLLGKFRFLTERNTLHSIGTCSCTGISHLYWTFSDSAADSESCYVGASAASDVTLNAGFGGSVEPLSLVCTQ